MSAGYQILLQVILTVIAANSYPLLSISMWFAVMLPVLIVVANTLPIFQMKDMPTFQLRICAHGHRCLKAFIISLPICIVIELCIGWFLGSTELLHWLVSIAICVVVEAILFWNGMISVYASSVQLGIRHRAVGIMLGLVPIANIVMLIRILKITGNEIRFEQEKYKLEEGRKDAFLCRTRYPILFVHGVFFRDNHYLNYWGRIPKTLQKNGAEVYYGEHPSALSIADSAQILADRIAAIVRNTGCEKINIIAHSKGGLDCRYAMHNLDVAKYVASLTTVNTPHRGCLFADHLLKKVPQRIQTKIATTYNNTLKQLGDPNPDFMTAVQDLTSAHCTQFDADTPQPENVFCQSVGSLLKRRSKGSFPFNLFYRYVRQFDGANDGLVGADSFEWGERYQLLTTMDKRGISHMDIIDLTRENLPEFDVREFYVRLVSDLKQRGY
ncbi:MAG: triacylglycerol lipase [Ruminococcaceae bacterium]|nr:triacylglycerol lipase [Oscillospiraceae bacterium]